MWSSQSSDSVTQAPKPSRGPPPTSPAWETWTKARGEAEQDTGLEPIELTQIPALESLGSLSPTVMGSCSGLSVHICPVWLVTASNLTGE